MHFYIFCCNFAASNIEKDKSDNCFEITLLDIKQFNKELGDGLTDKNQECDGCPTTPDAITNASADGSSLGGDTSASTSAGGEGGGMGEALKQELTEKRETKRYYVRPQDIFCANKADVLKALIDVSEAGENCSVYSLKNLSDHDDVHKLTNNDIIYYYDDNVLYDKNHVMVMDYDLFIKHEEERKRIKKDPALLTKQELDQNYGDRMTKNSFVENKQISRKELKENMEQIPLNAFKLALARGEEVELGYGDAYDGFGPSFEDGAPYSDTKFVAYYNDGKYGIHADDYSADGDVEPNYNFEEATYDTIEELLDAIAELDLSECNVELPDAPTAASAEPIEENPFDLTFEAYDVFGNRLTEAKQDRGTETCCICGEEYEGYGNNAEPYKKGYCCDACLIKFVLPARMQAMTKNESLNEDLEGNTQKIDFETDKYSIDLELFSAEDELHVSTYDTRVLNVAKGKGTIEYYADIIIRVIPKNGGKDESIYMAVPFGITKLPFTFQSYDEGEEFNHANIVDWNSEDINDSNIEFYWNQLGITAVVGDRGYDDYSEAELIEAIRNNEAKLKELIIANQDAIFNEINERLQDKVLEDIGYTSSEYEY